MRSSFPEPTGALTSPGMLIQQNTSMAWGNVRPLVLAVLIVLSLTNIDLFVGPRRPIPHFWGFLFACLLFVRQPRGLSLNELKVILLLLLFPSISLFTADMAYFLDRLKGYLAFLYSIAFGFIFFRILTDSSHRVIVRGLFIIIASVLILVALERFGGLQDHFSRIRGILHPVNTYTNDGRDLRMVGFVRPKLIWREPAHLAQFMTVVLWGLAILAPRKLRSLAAIAGLSLLSYLLIGSPVILLSLLGVGIIYASFLFRHSTLIGTLVMPAFCFAAILIVPAFFGGGDAPTFMGQGRITSILNGEDGSLQKRIGIPASIAHRVVAERPLFGLGISGTEAAFREFSEGNEAFGIRLYRDGSWHTKIHSSFVNAAISFGLLGSLIFVVCFLAAFRLFLGLSGTLLLIALISVIQLSMGGIVTPSFWLPIFFLGAVIAKSQPPAAPPAQIDALHRSTAQLRTTDNWAATRAQLTI